MRDAGGRTYPGRIVPVAEVEVRPQVSGEILEVGFRNGQHVDRGAVLYRLDPVQYRAAAKNAEAKVAELKSNLAYAELTAERYETLVKTRAVSQDDLDHARSSRDALAASLSAAEATFAAAQDDLAHCTIVAPISGRVGTTAKTEGNYVQKGEAGLVALVQTDPVRACFRMANVDYAELFAGDAGRMACEAVVSISLVSGGPICATGKVEYVENKADALTDTVSVYVRLANPRGWLLVGQTVMATVRNEKGVLRAAVPPNAVAQDVAGPYVWVVKEDGSVEKRRIARGELQDGMLLVKAGLRPRERIVADGVHRVHAHARIIAE